MAKVKKGKRRRALFLFVASFFIIGIAACLFFWKATLSSRIEDGWRTLTRESKRMLGLKEAEIPPEEKQIRENVIFKKMEEAGNQLDWRPSFPDYPRLNPRGPFSDKEKMKTFRNTPEFREMDEEVKAYLKKKEDLFDIDLPMPSFKDGIDFTRLKDKGAEKAMEKLLSGREKTPPEISLEENVRLGIKGPLVFRKILERPPPPSFKVKVEAEIELTFWVLPNGMVDRVIPSVKGDVELERIAIQYLKQWRFVPLPKEQPQVEQWGTIPIKFRLQ